MSDKPNTIRVVSAIADKKLVTLYLENGEPLIIKQGDHRLDDMMSKIIPITTKGEVAVIELDTFNIYQAFEEKSQGLTKFFRVAKNKVTGWFGSEPDKEATPAKAAISITDEAKEAVLRAVRGEEPLSEENIEQIGKSVALDETIPDDEVIVAVVTNKETNKRTVIPGVASLKPLIQHAVRHNAQGSVQAFLDRCAKFIDKRAHSVDDLMRFLERGDLPLAEDGSIIAYKILRWKDQATGVMVDCHSGNIPQKVGSFVSVNENLVDLDRRNDCSNGLHIARRGYLGGFNGDVCVLCKIDPEDVMVVPHRDPNKVRVKGYHILGIMSPEAMRVLKDNRPMTGEEAALKMVYEAIKGNHVARLENVQVNASYGGKVVITPITATETAAKTLKATEPTKADLKVAEAIDSDPKAEAPHMNLRDINKQVTQELSKTGESKVVTVTENTEIDGVTINSGDKVMLKTELSDKEVARPTPTKEKVDVLANLLLDFQTSPDDTSFITSTAKGKAAAAIYAYKQKKKKTWDKLGVSQALELAIMAYIDTKPKSGTKEKTKAAEVVKTKKPVKAPKKAETIGTSTAIDAKGKITRKPIKAGIVENKGTVISDDKPVSKSKAEKPKKTTNADLARALCDNWNKSHSTKDLEKLIDFKKSVKKSWISLGLTTNEINKIERILSGSTD